MRPSLIRMLPLTCMLIATCAIAHAQGPIIIDQGQPTLERPTIIEGPAAGQVIYDEPNPATFVGDPRPTVRVTLDGKTFAMTSYALLAEDKYVICDSWTLLRALRATVSHAEDWSWVRGDLGNRHVVWHVGERKVATHEGDVRTAAASEMVGEHLFIPLISTANNLGYRVVWDRQALTADIRTPAKVVLTGFKITDHQVEWPVLHRLPGGYMLLAGRIMKSGQPRLFCAEGRPRGDKWRQWDLPLPSGMDPNGHVGGWAMGDDFVFCHGAMDVPLDQPDAFPFWCGGVGKSWSGSVLRGSPRAAYREVRSLAVAHERAEFLIATGVEYTAKSDIPYGTWRVWRSDDTGLTWRAISVNGQDDFGNAEIKAVGTPRTVWSWANSVGKNHLIRSDVYGDTSVNTPQGFSDAVAVSGPNWLPVYMVWTPPSAAPNAARTLSHSADRGATWQQVETSFWPVCAMGWYDYGFGMIYSKGATSSLYWTHNDCANWFRRRIDGWTVLDDALIARSNMEAYMLAHKANRADKRLHCLRWELQR